MTLPTKILLALSLVTCGAAAISHADMTAKDTEAAKFAPAASNRGPASVDPADQSALEDRGEIADDQTEGGVCTTQCHPAFNYSPKTALARFDLNKIK